MFKKVLEDLQLKKNIAETSRKIQRIPKYLEIYQKVLESSNA